MSKVSANYPFSSRISISTGISIIASLAVHGALFAFPNLSLFSVEDKPIKTTPIPVVELSSDELARLPDLSPKPTQIPEFPNTPLPSQPLLETAIQFPFANIPTPPPPLPNTSLFFPPDPVDQANVKPGEDQSTVKQDLADVPAPPITETIQPPPPPNTTDTDVSKPNDPPVLPVRDDLQEQKRQLEEQQKLEAELNFDLDTKLRERSTEDILRELANPQISRNSTEETENPLSDLSKTPISPVVPRGWPSQVEGGNYPSEEEINSVLRYQNQQNSAKDPSTLARDNTRVEIQQRMAALQKDTVNTSEKEATNNYLSWLITINQVEPENLIIKGQYPKDACLQKLQGSSTYGVLVNAKGEAINLQLIQSSGYPIFNQNARNEISFYEFKKDAPKPYLVKVEFVYDKNRCPEQLPSADQNSKPVSDAIPPSVNNTSSQQEKPESTPVTGEKKPEPTPVTGEKKPDSTPVTEEKKPEPTPVTEEKKPEPTPVTGKEKSKKN
jgi:hypothetical protein